MQKDEPGRSHPHHVKEGRERDLDEREAALEALEKRVNARVEALAHRGVREQELLADADKRDDAANARDAVASERDMAASVEELLEMPADAATLRARALAATDRADSRHDRAASKTDRSKLTND
jgi:hypothetical protein